ncbi:hypothetical protein D3C86_1721060 [compost metagenome]
MFLQVLAEAEADLLVLVVQVVQVVMEALEQAQVVQQVQRVLERAVLLGQLEVPVVLEAIITQQPVVFQVAEVAVEVLVMVLLT